MKNVVRIALVVVMCFLIYSLNSI